MKTNSNKFYINRTYNNKDKKHIFSITDSKFSLKYCGVKNKKNKKNKITIMK